MEAISTWQLFILLSAEVGGAKSLSTFTFLRLPVNMVVRSEEFKSTSVTGKWYLSLTFFSISINRSVPFIWLWQWQWRWKTPKIRRHVSEKCFFTRTRFTFIVRCKKAMTDLELSKKEKNRRKRVFTVINILIVSLHISLMENRDFPINSDRKFLGLGYSWNYQK